MYFPNYLLLLAVFAAVVAADSPTAYQVLQSYDFPVGLLPKGVTGYEINSGTGRFAVYLSQTCTFTIHGYNLKYRTKITGTISKDTITNLSGIQVKVLFLWLNIIQVTKSDDGQMHFSVGIASAGFPVSSFYVSPQCGCGFHCRKGTETETRRGFGLDESDELIPLLQA